MPTGSSDDSWMTINVETNMDKKALTIDTYRLIVWTKDSMVVVLIRMARNDYLKLMSVKMVMEGPLIIKILVMMT
jgi:hypothetical protein